jgi:hypothetical protein
MVKADKPSKPLMGFFRFSLLNADLPDVSPKLIRMNDDWIAENH